MEAKRKILFIIAVIGMIGTFLPWARWGPLSVSGAKGDGWFTFVFFGIAAALCFFKGEKSQPLPKGSTTLVSIMGILGFLFGLWKIIRFTGDNLAGVSLGIGLWVVTLAGALIIYLNYFKKKQAIAGAPAEPVIAAGPSPAPAPAPVITPPPATPAAPIVAAPYKEPEAPPEESEERERESGL